MRIVFSSGFEQMVSANKSFDKGIMRVCYTGKNRNGSYISKETFERNMKTIRNVPIVCRYDREEDEIGAHDMDVVKNGDGELSLVNLTTPVGVIPESATQYWDTVVEDDGQVHEYLYTEALIWKRQEAYKKIKENGITDESMEISVTRGHNENGIYIIDDFEFTAFCLLGTAEPCYESAALLSFAQDEFKQKWSSMMKELKEELNGMQASEKEDGIKTIYSEGGNTTLEIEKKDELKAELDEENKTVNQTEEDNVDDADELDRQTEGGQGEGGGGQGEGEMEDIGGEGDDHEWENNDQGGSQTNDGDGEGNSGGADAEFALAEQFVNELVKALSEEKVVIDCGCGESFEVPRYWYCDYDPEAKEVYCYDLGDDWNIYGIQYSMDGDYVVLNYECKKRKKCAYVDFDEGSRASSVAQAFNLIVDKCRETNKKMDELKSFKLEAEKKQADAERKEVFAQFVDLEGDESFEAMKENCELSKEALEEKCYALRGRKQTMNFSVQEQKKAPKLPVARQEAGDVSEPYGGAFVEYNIG